ncbi:hypothetical protein PoB_006079900 [Plakobranchus ocellatus]|uniref:Uncharacterized protein n=1 Tax=Plakobranchus ocellatus TaxID=259542 RepID=A0AAV4CQW4_9GAST|nr:hypothetical protein PoB_006079900 [Plakobranchus ocellatus]
MDVWQERDVRNVADDIFEAEGKYIGTRDTILFLNAMHPHRQHLSTLPYAKRTPKNPTDFLSPVKRSSSLNEVLRRLKAMQGQNYSGRATRMRFGAGGRRK